MYNISIWAILITFALFFCKNIVKISRDELHGGVGSNDGNEQFLLRISRQKNRSFHGNPHNSHPGNVHPRHTDRVAPQWRNMGLLRHSGRVRSDKRNHEVSGYLFVLNFIRLLCLEFKSSFDMKK